jgi:hypothetical protein
MTSNANNSHPQDEHPPPVEKVLVFQWTQFNATFPTDMDARKELHGKGGEPFMPECQHCRSAEVLVASGGKVIYCMSCRKNTWLMAQTFFHNIRRPRAWLFAIWLMERGIIPSLLQFHRLAGIAYSTAWNIFKKLSMVVEASMLTNFEAVSSSVFSLAVSRRSRETPARSHPCAEIEEVERMRPDKETSGAGSEAQMSPETVGEEEFDIGDLTEPEKQLRDLLKPEPIHFDDLIEKSGLATGQVSAALTMLEFSGIATCLPGNWYSRRSAMKGLHASNLLPVHSTLPKNAKALSQVIDAAIAFFRATFHGISRKYLQLFLALFWCHIDRIRWTLGSLLAACHQFDPITDEDVLSYVSPSLIKTSA